MEQAILASVRLKDSAYRDSWPIAEAAAELKELALSSGLQVAEEVSLQRDRPSSSYFIGKGTAQALAERCSNLNAQVVVFGEDLDSAQQRNLEDLIGVKVIDRTQLILDIFAQRAHSQEGKVQVELAQLQYLLPRLVGKGILLSQLGGGIGTRGPGEKKLEVDRRRIRLRIRRLKQDLEEIHRRRGIARRKREEEAIPSVALIGYTNVGKTTLLNALTGAGAVAEDRVFTTLDPLARRLVLPGGQPILVTDTVGFLHRLPHHLIEAFRATLEETTQSHLLLHLLDVSHPMLEEQASAVHEVLQALGAEGKSMITVLNKVDRVDPAFVQSLKRRLPEAVCISALRREGLAYLLERVSAALGPLMREALIWIPEHQHRWEERIYQQGQVFHRRILENGLELQARVPHKLYGQLAKAGLVKS